MNLFLLDQDIDKSAQYHIDKHVQKMQLQAAQMLTTALWVDRFLGFVPRKLQKQQLQVIAKKKAIQPPIYQRTFTRYLPTHINHPSTIWVRSSLQNYMWTICYVDALNSQCAYRGYKSPSISYDQVKHMALPQNMPDLGFTKFALAMSAYPQIIDQDDPVGSYRRFYKLDKAQFASWKIRQKPHWWQKQEIK